MRTWQKWAMAMLIVSLAMITAVAGKTGKITGRITDKVTGDPIPYAIVSLKGTTFGAATDDQGNYTILNVPPGKYELVATCLGFTAVKQSVEVFADSAVVAKFALIESKFSGDTVVVKAERDDLRLNTQGTQRSANPSGSEQAMSPLTVDKSPSLKKGIAVQREHSGRHFAAPYSATLPHPSLYGAEEYGSTFENEFRDPWKHPLSTFSIDVDPASYANARRFLNEGRLPPPDAVRVEEFLNYFDYDYAEPHGEHPFSITTEISSCPWNREHRLVHIGLRAKTMQTHNLPPSNLVFLIDVSGSMDWPDKLPLVKSALRMLLDELRPQDRVAIVTYAGSAGVALSSTPGNFRREIAAAIDALQAGGRTAGGAGIQLAYRIAQDNFKGEGNNRIILATDGDFNVGITDTDELIRMITKKREEGIYLTVLGVGTGNLKDHRMEQLADKCDGNYAYIDNILEAQKVLVNELAGTLYTVAKDVKIQIEFNPSYVRNYRLVGYENRMLRKEDFANDRKDAGDMGSGHSVTALYEIVPVNAPGRAGDDGLRYQHVDVTPIEDTDGEILTVKLRYKRPGENESQLLVNYVIDQHTDITRTSPDFRFSAAVAEFGLLLSDSQFKHDASFDRVIDMARNARGFDEDGNRAEFVRLAEVAKSLSHHIGALDD